MGNDQTLSEYVAGEIRAEIGRRRTSGRELAEKLGVSRSWVSYRLTGATEITLNDLAKIADALNVTVTDLLPTGQATGQPSRRYRRVADWSQPVDKQTMTDSAYGQAMSLEPRRPVRRATIALPPSADSVV